MLEKEEQNKILTHLFILALLRFHSVGIDIFFRPFPTTDQLTLSLLIINIVANS